MNMTDRQRELYEKTLAETRGEIDDIDRQIEEELNKVKARIQELRDAKKASREMYNATCIRLGIPNDLEADDDTPVK